MLLAIDTSTTLTGLACYDDSGLLGECVWESHRNHTKQVLPQITMLMHHIGCIPADIHAVGVAIGPGSWSGLRVGISIAKGIAIAGSAHVVGIGTLDILAYQHSYRALPVLPLIRLGRGRFATARFQQEDHGWQRTTEYRNVTLVELCMGIREPVLFCGDLDAALQAELQRELEGYALFADVVSNVRRPGYLAALAWQRFGAGEHDDVALLEPIYLGEPVNKS